MTPIPSRLRAVLRLAAFVAMNLLVVSAYAACVGPLRRWRRPVQIFWCRLCRLIIGLKVQVIGQCHRQPPVLFVANHLSYLDIPVIATEVDGCFVAKADVRDWPWFGLIARITGTVFVKRIGNEALQQGQELLTRLLGGENLILFPEGTSTDGRGVAPFKSTLFNIAERLPPGEALTIQPVSIAYVRYTDGTPLSGPLRELYGWFGDMALAPHLFRALGLRGCEVELRFHSPITVDRNADRKRLAREAHTAVARGVAVSQAGIPDAEPWAGDTAEQSMAVIPLNAVRSEAAGERRRSAPSGR